MVVSPKKILWPTDFSTLSLQAGRYARGFREVFDSELHVIHVVPPPYSADVSVMLPADIPVAAPEADVVAFGFRTLKKVIDEHFDGDQTIQLKAFVGNPWMGVCDYAREQHIDLIIVATHGHTGLKHVLLGSLAEQIVRHAPCPVLTVKVDEKDFIID
ncbi:MAG: TRAP-T-associated universal stress protein TeaD [Phycisphaerae bacterium]|nr:TRAP-T-associated universal stress protein TeaD [Phycisphaerae bacterium]